MRWWLGAISNLPKHILPFPGCPPIPPPWCLRSKSCLSLPFTRSLQLCGFILNTPGLFEYLPSHLPLPASSARLPSAALSAPLSADSSVHFTARDDLCVIPKRKGEREGSELTFWPTWLGLNQTCLAPFNLSFSVPTSHYKRSALPMQQNYAALCIVTDPEISPAQLEPCSYVTGWLPRFLEMYFWRNAAFSIHHHSLRRPILICTYEIDLPCLRVFPS